MSFGFGFSFPAYPMHLGAAMLLVLSQEDGFAILQEDGFLILVDF
jgi:hypothetical protein